MDSILFSYLTHQQSLGYALIFIGMIIEGDIILFTSSFLAHQRFFDLGDLAFFVLIAVFIGDSLWYLTGRLIDNSFLGRWIIKIVGQLDNHLVDHPCQTIFVSKFIYGIHHALIMRLGTLRFPWQKFIKIDFISTLPWVLIVGGLGYFSGAVFSASKHYLRFAEAGLLVTLILFLVIKHFIIKKIKL